MGKLTTQDFINKARAIHGDKYDYSLVNYINNHTNIIIICSIHGEFLQTPNAHLNGCGCPKCIGRHKTTQEFIDEAKAIHGNKYDYSKVKYTKAESKVIIGCPMHGEFEQKSNLHLMGYGCKKCANNFLSKIKKSNTEEFIKKAKEIHSNKYDYSQVNYVNNSTKVIIICSEHGEFEQKPAMHLQGQGCPKCAGRIKLTIKQFIEKAKKVHDNKYDYSKSNYTGTDSKVTIICPEHGEFEQTPYTHLNGSNCPKCMGIGLTYLPLNEVRKIIKSLGIKHQAEYFKWWSDNIDYCRKMGIPRNPQQLYTK